MTVPKSDYQTAYDAFSLDEAFSVLSVDTEAGWNAAYQCCDRHCGEDAIALIHEDGRGGAFKLSFEELRAASSRFANAVTAMGIKPGDTIAGLLPRTPELLITIIGAWRVGAVYQPLFTAFGPKAIEHRLEQSRARLVVTDAANRSKLEGISLSAEVMVTGGSVGSWDRDFDAMLSRHDPVFAPVHRTEQDPFLVMFTSGTTGLPKSLLVPLKAVAAFAGYMVQAVDLRQEDSFWNIADPGWAYGLYYSVTGPLALGHATLFYEGAFSVDGAIDVIVRNKIDNLAGSPSAYRLMIAAGPDALDPIRGQLRSVSSAGEPLNPEVIRWFSEHLETTVHDHYGQTETGMVICNHHGLSHDVRMGSAGYSVPGHRVVVLDNDGKELGEGVPGILSVDRANSPLFWFDGYRGVDTPALGDRYYLSGDTVELNEDGSISFVGRSDDVITSSGYRIGPFDVESALLEHPAVVEAAVIGKPDPERTEIVKAFVVLADGAAASPDLSAELQQHVRSRLSAHAYPREVEFIDELPKTPSGKVQRFMLRNRELA